ncbi:carboxylesterase type B [Thecamonas trahens ATCC 50062]|uniref:Carboxylic ester hydrolase n=1 Tax=Thecamonas trahens ATCC 50062 TaxID=461836 RepID=A0A0L0DXI8_THETB|nr:carboxylesterase type B [Thecamonas trahens ATCC 50062]KNC56253.1 carboxylesterase type B [Thecamonas trahens ATCC 50062]|eukprot:XP_013760775.1 carboxylesterase type B [Thecamonas trahens ATCC 50062]
MIVMPWTVQVVVVLLAMVLLRGVEGMKSGSEPCHDVVVTALGSIRGVCNGSFSDMPFRVFKGIRYGASTGGSNRFMPPIAAAPWKPATLDATAYGWGCIQTDHNPDVPKNQSEDCLFLNVWTPYGAEAGDKLPVTFFIHGGTFKEGAGSLYGGGGIAGIHNNILVTINYRLGPPGWVVTGPIKGNMGLQDQLLALAWVNDHIAAFGGDASKITIQGESAGAMSVGIHLTSPAARGLFSKAIMESNVAGYRYRDAKAQAVYGRAFAKDLGCAADDLVCMQQAPVAALDAATRKAAQDPVAFIFANPTHPLDGFIQWEPTVGTELFPEQVLDALAAGHYDPSVPILMGTNAQEAVAFLGTTNISGIEYEAALDIIFGPLHAHEIKSHPQYAPPKAGESATFIFSRVLTDYWFECPSLAYAAHFKAAYVYLYNHLLSFNPFGHYLPQCVDYVCHGEELALVFRGELFGQWFTLPPVDLSLSERMIDYWTAFATSGSVNTGSGVGFEWPSLVASAKRIVFNDTLATESLPSVCAMWDKFGYNH